MGDRIDPQRGSRGQVIGTGNTAQEENLEAKKRRVEKGWNDRFFAHLGVGSGMGGAAAINAYKVANPGWTKARDKWAQAQVKAKAAPKPGTSLGGLVK